MRNGLPTMAALLLLASPFPRSAAAEPPPPAAEVDPKTGEVPPDAPVVAEPDPYPVPPGSPADQKLWTATRDVSSRVGQCRYNANKLQWKIKTDGLAARLDAAIKADPAAAPKLEGLRKRLLAVQGENLALLTGKWPVDPTRVCQYALVNLSASMFADDSPQARSNLAESRDRAAYCEAQARGASERMEKSNEALAAVVAEVEKAVPAPGAAKPATPGK